MMEFLFLDLDDTILDFQKAERLAISRTFLFRLFLPVVYQVHPFRNFLSCLYMWQMEMHG